MSGGPGAGDRPAGWGPRYNHALACQCAGDTPTARVARRHGRIDCSTSESFPQLPRVPGVTALRYASASRAARAPGLRVNSIPPSSKSGPAPGSIGSESAASR